MKIINFMLKVTSLLLIFLIMTFLIACSKIPEKSLQKVKLNEVTRSIFYCPQYLALELGYFEDEGLDVELTTGEGSDKTMTAVLSSQADIGLLGSSSVMSVYSQGRENYPIMFAQITQRDGSFLVGRSANFDWEHLKGKSLIAGRKGGIPEMTLEYILKKKGLIPGQDVTLINNIQFSLMGIAFSRGVGDYVTLFEPAASVMKREKGFNLLVPLGKECEKMVYTCYCAPLKYIKDNPRTIQNFVNAVFRAEVWLKTHSADEAAKVIAPYFIDADKELLVNSIDNYCKSDVWPDNPIISPESFDLTQEIMIGAGELESKIDWSKVVDNTYALNAVNNKPAD